VNQVTIAILKHLAVDLGNDPLASRVAKRLRICQHWSQRSEAIERFASSKLVPSSFGVLVSTSCQIITNCVTQYVSRSILNADIQGVFGCDDDEFSLHYELE
jgi:hypothetical protein